MQNRLLIISRVSAISAVFLMGSPLALAQDKESEQLKDPEGVKEYLYERSFEVIPPGRPLWNGETFSVPYRKWTLEDGRVIYSRVPPNDNLYVAPQKVQAGTVPAFVGDAYDPHVVLFPGLARFSDPEEYKIASSLWSTNGVGKSVSRYVLGGAEHLSKVPIAYVLEDLAEAGATTEISDIEGITRGLLRIFRVVVDTPMYESTLPATAQLHVEYTKTGIEHVVERTFDMELSDNGYLISDLILTLEQIRTVPDDFFTAGGAESRGITATMVKMTGFDVESMDIKDMPEVEGVPLVHHVYYGSYRVVSGWQWAGRPPGLQGTQQPGFLQR